MKSLKTYNLDQDVIKILKNVDNKSRYVCRAVRRFNKNIEELDIRGLPTRQLMAALASRSDLSPQFKAVILAELVTSNES